MCSVDIGAVNSKFTGDIVVIAIIAGGQLVARVVGEREVAVQECTRRSTRLAVSCKMHNGLVVAVCVA